MYLEYKHNVNYNTILTNYMNNKIIMMALAVTLIALPLSGSAHAMKISCADNIDLEKFPICNYVTEWNESKKFDEKVLAELTLRVIEINADPESFPQIYQETLDKVNLENPGLQEKSQKLKDWLHDIV